VEGRYNLALPEKEFWRLTLAQFLALRRGYEAREEWQNFRAAEICSVIANTIPREKGAKPFTYKDFMPGEPEAGHGEPVKVNKAQMVNFLRGLAASCGGREVKLNG
jgi:hypothetical protein